MQNYNNPINNCCCSCGIKKGICMLKNLSDLIESHTVYYTCGSSDGVIKDSKYPNFILIEEASKNINICIEDINFIKIEPVGGNYQHIINELNKQYVSPFVLCVPCDENCCCKSSSASYLKDKYLEPDPAERKFIINIKGETSTIPTTPRNKVSVVHLDHDIVWVLDSVEQILYLVSLCNICALID